MNKWILAVVAIVIVITSVLVATHQKKATVVGDHVVIAEVGRLRTEVFERNLTREDFTQLGILVSQDEHAMEFVREALWLSDHSKEDHMEHSLYYLNDYVKNGVTDVCVPHELSHIKLYLEFNDTALAQTQLKVAKDAKKDWLIHSNQVYSKFPQYYPKYKEMLSAVDEVLIRLDKKQYDERTSELLAFVEEYEVC